MATYITGDTHGNLKQIHSFCYKMKTTTDDTLVILGDVGINYFNTEQEKKAKAKYNNFGITMLCIHGNHEERPFNIPSYKTKKWKGGIVYYEEEYPNILFAKDGEIYDLDGKKCIVIGGAYSVDKWFRIFKAYAVCQYFMDERLSDTEYENAILYLRGEKSDNDGTIRESLSKAYELLPQGYCTWFKDELPSKEIKMFVESQLANNQIDVVFSHTCPEKYIPKEMFLKDIDQSSVDNSVEMWLDKIENNLKYQKWYCGHWHTDKTTEKMTFLFKTFCEL